MTQPAPNGAHEPVAWRHPFHGRFGNITSMADYRFLFAVIERAPPGMSYIVVLRNGQTVRVRRK